jgi:translation initiation factor IF-2
MRGGNQHIKKKNTSGQMQQKNFHKGKKPAVPVKKVPVNVSIPDEISVGELASRLKVTAAEVVKKLMLMGMMVTVNQFIDYDTAYLVADELGANVTKEVVVTIEEKLFEEQEDTAENLLPRAPVVCVMGHVDHGKTSLLDAIRNTHVTTGEAGGITQHIGAYRVKVKGQDITFLDTPGHEAFTAMRARGAMATDIAILVVAADDGIMPQTIEAINHAKAAGVDIIVAINKMDKPTANPDAIKQELTKYDLVPEEWGGDVMCIPVSAHTHMGIDDLLESVLLVAEVKELKANPNRRAKGIVIEGKLDKGRGPVVTVLVQGGTLHNGDIVIAGTAVGRVRAMTDHTGRTVKEAAPSVPVELIGLDEVPTAGDEFNAVEDERMARELADKRRNQAKEEEFKANSRASLDDLFNQISEGVKTLGIIVKADVVGSAEAVKASLEKISNEEVRVKVIHSAAGGINEGDVMLAAASNAIIVGFNVRPDKGALDSAERQNVEIRTYRVIYDAIEEITAAMKGMLAPKFKEVLLGHAEVRQTIHVPGVGTIAGSYIQDGKITRNAQIRVVRDGVVVYEDKITSLRRFKDDVREVAAGYECGVGLEKFNDIKLGDVLEAFVMEEVKQ